MERIEKVKKQVQETVQKPTTPSKAAAGPSAKETARAFKAGDIKARHIQLPESAANAPEKKESPSAFRLKKRKPERPKEGPDTHPPRPRAKL